MNAEVVPAGATAVILNATVVRPSTRGFLSIRPGDATGTPATSNINWAAGGANIANAVIVQLPASGQVDVFVNGTVAEVLIDVAGYFTDSALTDLDNRVTALEIAQPLAAEARTTSASLPDTSDVVIASLGVVAPADGVVTFSASSYANVSNLGTGLWRCSLSTDSALDLDYSRVVDRGTTDVDFQTTSIDRMIPVAGGATATVNLVCNVSAGSALMFDSVITGIFTQAA